MNKVKPVKWTKSDTYGNYWKAHIYDRFGFKIKYNDEYQVYKLFLEVYTMGKFKIGNYKTEEEAKSAAQEYVKGMANEIYISINE